VPSDECQDRLEKLITDVDFTSVAEWKAAHPGSKAIAYFPVYAPAEIIHAFGALPVALHGVGFIVLRIHLRHRVREGEAADSTPGDPVFLLRGVAVPQSGLQKNGIRRTARETPGSGRAHRFAFRNGPSHSIRFVPPRDRQEERRKPVVGRIHPPDRDPTEEDPRGNRHPARRHR
jgi:hypothetical protein